MRTIVARLMDAVPSGSYLAISQIAGDVAANEVAEGGNRNPGPGVTPFGQDPRTRPGRASQGQAAAVVWAADLAPGALLAA